MIRTERSSTSWTRYARGSALVLAVSMLAGCGSDDGGATAGNPEAAPGTVTPTTTQPGGGSTAATLPPGGLTATNQPAGGSTAATAEQTITVRVTDQGVEVSPTSTRPGPATFQVTNNATHPQDVEIDGPGEDGDIDDLPLNQTRSVNMTLEAGEYEIQSENEGAPDQSRSTRLVVQN